MKDIKFLPTTQQELMGKVADFVLISADAYVDHPSFGHAVIGRLIQHLGFTIGIIAQPQCDKDYMVFGQPKQAFLVSGGVVDSMVNNYTVSKHRRTEDVYSPKQEMKRPDRATSVYSNALKRLFPDSYVIIGGIEASLRRFAHYDYWSDRVMPSILYGSNADLLIYGMGEKPFIDLCDKLNKNIPIDKIKDIDGTAYMICGKLEQPLLQDIAEGKSIMVESLDDVSRDKVKYVNCFNKQSKNTDSINGKRLIQQQSADRYLVVNKPQQPLTTEQMDMVYSLPYTKQWHPMYDAVGGIKALEEVKFSLTSQRGCFGGCNFCALTYHQGRVISHRSKQSLVDEATELTTFDDFKGYIHDVGGATANFYNTACDKQKKLGVCQDRQCIGSKPCPNLKVDHTEYLEILRSLRHIKGIKKVFVRSGVRFDYLMYDKDDSFFNELVQYHISGQLKVAPEHIADSVLQCMNKPSSQVYLSFIDKYHKLNAKFGKQQFVVPYLISSHPGCTLANAIQLACYLKSINYMPEQVQDFYPTPSTKSTTMYYTGINPDTNKEVYVAKTVEEKALQRALLQYRKKENYNKIFDALVYAKRMDLIGYDAKCLIKPQDKKFTRPSTSKNKPFKLNKR